MNFSRYRLHEGQAVSAGTQGSLDTSNKGSESAGVGREKAMSDKQVGGERQRRMRAQKADPRGAGQVFEDLRKEVENIKRYEAQKSDWRSELQEKVIDGQEREKHPFITVMPTGDENMIQALKQMGKAIKGKKDDMQESCSDGCDCEKCKKKAKKKLEEKKKECKDGYTYNSDTKQCEKKKKSKSTTNIFIGGRYGGHHDHDEDDSDDNDNSGGDGGEGGGMGEALELMGELLEMDLKSYQKMTGAKPGAPKKYDPDAREKQRGAQIKQMIKNKKRSKDDKETKGRYP